MNANALTALLAAALIVLVIAVKSGQDDPALVTAPPTTAAPTYLTEPPDNSGDRVTRAEGLRAARQIRQEQGGGAPAQPPSSAPTSPSTRASVPDQPGCKAPDRVVPIVFDRDDYPTIIAHIEKSWTLGYPKVLTINRPGADERRDELLADYPTREGFDRDEAPAAVLRDTVRAYVDYAPSSENRSAGASLGNQISPYCDGVRVRYRFVA